MEVSVLLADEVRDLADHAAQRGSVIAFQSTLAAAAQAVQRALQHEKNVSEAALSLAHRDALGNMTTELRTTQAALEAALDSQGRCIMPARRRERKRPFPFTSRALRQRGDSQRPTWFGSLASAIEVLDWEADRMRTLVSGQPAGTPSRALGAATAHLLRSHHDRLAAEAERVI